MHTVSIVSASDVRMRVGVTFGMSVQYLQAVVRTTEAAIHICNASGSTTAALASAPLKHKPVTANACDGFIAPVRYCVNVKNKQLK
jgi:hypothetical protein